MPPALILIIEDDPNLARLLNFDLQAGGFAVKRAPSALWGLDAARERRPALVLLDLDLPDLDGAQVVARLRKTSGVPIIVLSASGALVGRVQLLELWANDYLIRPVHEDELLARIRAHLRRHQESTLVCGDLILFPMQRWAKFQGRELHFSSTEFGILTLLASCQGQVVSRAGFNKAFWDGLINERGSLITAHLRKVRRKLQAMGAGGSAPPRAWSGHS